MTAIHEAFLQSPHAPFQFPGMHSGSCYHKSRNYNPSHEHFAALLLDHNDQGERYFASIFAFFAKENEWKDWSVDLARKEMSASWKRYGVLQFREHVAHTHVKENEGRPVYFYWLRQNPATQSVYFITYWGGPDHISFCELRKNP